MNSSANFRKVGTSFRDCRADAVGAACARKMCVLSAVSAATLVLMGGVPEMRSSEPSWSRSFGLQSRRACLAIVGMALQIYVML